MFSGRRLNTDKMLEVLSVWQEGHPSRSKVKKVESKAGPKMAALRYRRFLKLCEEWPVDETKRGRDLGAYLRQRVAQAFREGENTQVTGGKEVGDVGTRGGRVGILRMRRPP